MQICNLTTTATETIVTTSPSSSQTSSTSITHSISNDVIDLGRKEEHTVQPRLTSYSPTLYGKNIRDFKASWFRAREQWRI